MMLQQSFEVTFECPLNRPWHGKSMRRVIIAEELKTKKEFSGHNHDKIEKTKFVL